MAVVLGVERITRNEISERWGSYINIIEAVKSGKRFKRKGDVCFMVADLPALQISFSLDDVLADDWEIEEKTITLSESEFDKKIEENWDKLRSGEFVISTIKKALFGNDK